MYKYPDDGVVEQVRKALPKGSGDWPDYNSVYSQLQKSCDELAKDIYLRCGSIHVEAMAALGSGHEDTMREALTICKWALEDAPLYEQMAKEHETDK